MMSNLSQQTTTSRLEYFPVTFFAMIMGLTGLTLAWEKAARVFQLPLLISNVLLVATACLFLIITLTYLLKLVLRTQAVSAEFNHPVKLSFFPAFSISMILLSIATLSISQNLSLTLWSMGATLHLAFTLYVLTQWIHHPKFQIAHSTPAWFIPVVGNILIPIAGVEHGYSELSWFFFSIGIVYWIVLKTLIFNRIIFHDPLPEKMLPTLFIMIAPPAVGFISYIKLNGELDNFARILFYAAMFLVLLLLSQFPRFLRIRFFMSWWAYSFPLAASAIASQVMYSLNPQPAFYYLALVLLILATSVISLLFIRTALAVRRHEICQPE
ncbi:MAG: SLAC1 anion channel family protein [Amphritea sp.]|nr:SLAC1 anion channel family protein [Amphritea sp.]